MTIVLNRKYYYFLFFILSSYLFVFTIANNDTDHHSNETIVEYNTTILSLTTIANISDEVVVNDDNKNDSLSKIFINTTEFSTSSVPLKITNVTILELNTTLNEDQNSTILVPEIDMKKNDEQTTMHLNASCELSKYGCCSDGVTERQGKNFVFFYPIELSSCIVQI